MNSIIMDKNFRLFRQFFSLSGQACRASKRGDKNSSACQAVGIAGRAGLCSNCNRVQKKAQYAMFCLEPHGTIFCLWRDKVIFCLKPDKAMLCLSPDKAIFLPEAGL